MLYTYFTDKRIGTLVVWGGALLGSHSELLLTCSPGSFHSSSSQHDMSFIHSHAHSFNNPQ